MLQIYPNYISIQTESHSTTILQKKIAKDKS